jgi:hypothetical protein
VAVFEQIAQDAVDFNGAPFFRSLYRETGSKVFASAAPTLKHLTLELGGNDPGIVLPDVDAQAIAETLFGSMLALSGQGCVTLKRHLVHESIYQGCFGKWLSPARDGASPFSSVAKGLGMTSSLPSRTAEAIGVRGTRLPLS